MLEIIVHTAEESGRPCGNRLTISIRGRRSAELAPERLQALAGACGLPSTAAAVARTHPR